MAKTCLLVLGYVELSCLQVWDAVAAWIQHDEPERSRHLLRLIGVSAAGQLIVICGIRASESVLGYSMNPTTEYVI